MQQEEQQEATATKQTRDDAGTEDYYTATKYSGKSISYSVTAQSGNRWIIQMLFEEILIKRLFPSVDQGH